MSEPLSPDLEAQARELATRIKARSADAILEMARRLVATTDETLFGDTAFAPRDQALGLVADAYTEHLPQKVATAPPHVNDPLRSTDTVRKRSKRSAGRSRATERITTAGCAKKAPAPGTNGSG